MSNPINLSPITQFIQTVRAAELSRAKEVKISIEQARMLNMALAETMNKLNQDYETMFNALKSSISTEVVSVSMDGGGFGDDK